MYSEVDIMGEKNLIEQVKSLVPVAVVKRSKYEELKRQKKARPETAHAQLVHVPPLRHHNIDLLFDVGANTGQYATNARREGYSGQIVSFEPLRQAHAALTTNARNDAQWFVHDRVAIGSRIGEVEINVSKNSYSSSILPILESHTSAAPQSVYTDIEDVPLETIDSIFSKYFRTGQKTYLKIDTQGYEAEVLSGAEQSLPDIFAVELELSTVPLYEGQLLYDYFINYLTNRGFLLWALMPGFSNAETGQMLQFDAVFVRPS